VLVKKVRARAPLRLGLAGGGTDLSPYCDHYGGNVLNGTISVFAYAFIEERSDWNIKFRAHDVDATDEVLPSPSLDLTSGLLLHRGVYNRIIRQFNSGRPLSIDVHTAVDAPPGSGLGSSSALVVALVRAYAEYLSLPLGDYDVAQLACAIERGDLNMAGGKQDQYSAAFGGLNFIEFLPSNRVIVNPMRVHEAHRLELECSLLVCYTGRSRVSSEIIKEQTNIMEAHDEAALAAMHQIKQEAVEMKLCLLRGDIAGMADVLNRSWDAKKRTAKSVSNDHIDEIYGIARNAGALAGKISGAGGGGFMMLIVPPESRLSVARSLRKHGLEILSFHFTDSGAESWTVP
jgi:D-glycero-alpha-D-manno-heptose-7-phosphate kinase